MNNLIIKYLRERWTNTPYGVVVSPAKGKIGVAICSPEDFFNKKVGITLALRRAQENLVAPIPYWLKQDYLKVNDLRETVGAVYLKSLNFRFEE